MFRMKLFHINMIKLSCFVFNVAVIFPIIRLLDLSRQIFQALLVSRHCKRHSFFCHFFYWNLKNSSIIRNIYEVRNLYKAGRLYLPYEIINKTRLWFIAGHLKTIIWQGVSLQTFGRMLILLQMWRLSCKTRKKLPGFICFVFRSSTSGTVVEHQYSNSSYLKSHKVLFVSMFYLQVFPE